MPANQEVWKTATAAAVGAVVGAAIAFQLSGRCKSASSCTAAGNQTTTTSSKAPSMFGPFDLDLIVRPNIAKLVPYRCARDDYDSGILLDANENTHGPPMAGTEAFAEQIERYRKTNKKTFLQCWLLNFIFRCD